MLNFIRERAQGWVAWFIVGLITIPFALWGVNSYLNGPSDIVTATVNGQAIKQIELQKAVQQYRERMRESMTDNFDPAIFEGPAIKKLVLDGLIQQKLLEQTNTELKQFISDAVVTRMIMSTPAFQTDGQFDPERYRLILARIGERLITYESQLKIDILNQELTNNIQKSSLVTRFDVDMLLRLEKQTRDIAYGVISASSMLDSIEVAEEQVKDYFEKNKANYYAPERVSVNYIELSVDDLAKSIEVDQEKLKEFYANNQGQFLAPEQRRASHILIEGDDAEALAKITTIQEQLESGKSFEELAKLYSNDSGSAQEGGDLGLFQRDVMDAAFGDAVFAMKDVGQISQPVKTEFGYHLIKLTDIKSSQEQDFDAVKSDIEAMFRRQKAEELFYEQAETLADLSYENPDNLEAAADALSLEIKHTEAFTRDGGKGIASDKKVVNVAFSEDVLVNNLNSAVIEKSKTDLVVIHKREHIASSLLPFESIAPAITEQLRFDKALELARERGEKILAELKNGKSPTDFFENENWHDTKTYTRLSDQVSSQVLQNAFLLPKPTSDMPQWSGFSAANGNFIVLSVSAVNEGDITKVSDEDREGLSLFLKRTNAGAELNAFIDSIKATADIEIFTENLK